MLRKILDNSVYEKTIKKGKKILLKNGKIFKENFEIPAKYNLGQRVSLDFGDAGRLENTYVRTIMFTEGKIRYSIILVTKEGRTTLHNIDSVFVKESNAEPQYIKMDFDNYS